MFGRICPSCWTGKNVEGKTVTYRPAGSAGDDTPATTVTVEINSSQIKELNVDSKGKKIMLKIKFCAVGATGASK